MKQLKHLDKLELAEAVKLADLVFRDPGQRSMGESFPAIFDPALGLSLGVIEEGRVVSFIGFVPQQIAVGDAVLDACALGSVCTHPDYRGQGHASVLLGEAFHQAEAIGASLMLISGTRSLYRRNGCHAFGSMRRYRLEAGVQPQADPRARPLQPADWFRLHSLSNAKPAAYRRSVAELAGQLRSAAVASMYDFTHRSYVLEEDGELAAYAVIASGPIPAGSDMEPFVVEWGGDDFKALAAMRAAMQEMRLPSLLLFVGSHETRMQLLLQGSLYSGSHNQGTVKIIDLPLLWRQLSPYLEGRRKNGLAAPSVMEPVRSPSGEFALRLGEDEIPLSMREWTALLFDGPDAELDDGPDAFVRQGAAPEADAGSTRSASDSGAVAGSARSASRSGVDAGSTRSTSRSGADASAETAVAVQTPADPASGPRLPFTQEQARMLRPYFPIPFPYTAGLSYI
ncbi:GNAT family N-acetyltransferase [Paenibacillus humicus]|uniref:GNAT family N-acetyltransferase n=1 Tax=Paenibacillus humicus TaxID=412861 RepID=UPI003F16E318